ncbi:MAG: PBP1A family penicillin-binding protein [Candidatus Buchananbacteria bacterium]|nr:PBP1A family penicillin-binding protein [Candidatus Buchananbacteria bacterium]
MTISQLSKKIKSSQDWRNPTYIRGGGYQHNKSSNNFSVSSKYRRPKNKKRLRKFFGILIPIFIFLFLVGGLFILGLFAWISKDLPNPDGVINRSITVSTKIYDRKGETVLYDIHGNIKRTLIQLNDIPDYVVNATLTAEDRNFYSHKGFSITGILRSILKNIFTGSKVGGSTLTQQFVKNAILTNEKTYTRKFKEILISYRLENKFSKDQILNMYFNEIPYGSVIYGIEAASQSFFGKSAKDLTVAEGAILAAIPQAPTYYSPYGNNKDKLIARQRYIIDSMSELGYITKDQAEQAKNEKIIFKPLQDSIIAPHFVMYVKELLSEKYGEEFINQEGLKVYTTLDLDKQKIAEEAIKQGVETNSAKYGFTNASLTAVDPKTGQIIAMVGSADYFNEKIDGQVNVSLRPRQPGSSFKPIVYTAAFIKGYTPNTILYDVVTNFDTTSSNKYEPHNYDLKEHGPVTIRKALQGSLNIPAVKTTYLTGLDNVLNLADDLGYTTLTNRDRFGLSLVLGGGEVRLLDHVGAYAVFANEGIKHDITPILKIEDKNGKVLFEYKDKKKEVLEPQYARLISNVLSDDEARSYIFGSGSKLTLPGRPVAVKTGTTNDYRDAWTIGYTPSLAAGVWVGNNNNSEMKKGADGSIIAAPIWNYFMKESLKDSAPEGFTAPEEIITGKPVLDGQETADVLIKIDTMSGKLATQYTPESTIKEINIKEIHNILYYINKDDPRGERPSNPEDDPQFKNWEDAVIKWAIDQGFDLNKDIIIPTEYDDIHLEQDQPNLIIISPLPGQNIQNNELQIDITAAAKRGIKKVEYYIDNNLITTKTDSSDTNLNISNITGGSHTLIIKVKDDLENTVIKSVDINK